MQNTLIFIDDPNQIKKLEKYVKNKNTKIISLNYETHKKLEYNKIVHEIGEDSLENKDLDNLDVSLVQITKNWYLDSEIRNHLIFDSLNIGKLLEMEALQFFTSFLIEIKSSLKIIKEEKPNLIIGMSKINPTLEKTCKKLEIDFLNLPPMEKDVFPMDSLLFKFNIGKFTFSKRISRGKFHLFKRYFEKMIYTPLNLLPNKSRIKNKSVLLFDFNIINYEQMINELKKSNYRIVLLNTRRPSIWNLKSLKIVFQKKCEIINLQKFKEKTYPEFNKESTEFSKNLETLFKNDKIFEKIFSFDDISFWDSIKNSFVPIILSRSIETISRILSFRLLLDTCNISKILFWAETGQEEGEILHVANQKNIKTIFLQHAMMQISEGHVEFGSFLSHLAYPSQSDLQLVWGESAKNFCSLKKSNNNVIPIGSPRHDQFFNCKQISGKKIILFAPTAPSGISCKNSTTNKILEFYNIVQQTCEITNIFPSYKFIVKPHPSPTFSNEVVDIAKNVSDKIKISFTSNVSALINQCDLLITTNNSTVAVEAMMMNKPVISIQSENWSLEEDIVTSNALFSLTDISQLQKYVKKILFDEEFKSNLIKNSKSFLDKHFSNHGESSKKVPIILDDIN